MPNTNYRFKLLEETSATEDLLEGKPHQRIADALYQSIYGVGSDGITIGLEGGWGAGKSTVISLFKAKIKSEIENGETYFFYFDAWEHEGDPLRRIFLEELIEQVSNNSKNNGKLKSVKEVISKRRKKIKTETQQTATWFGKSLALSALITPLVSAAPLFVMIINLGLIVFIRIKEKKKNGGLKIFMRDILTHDKWAFLQGETNTEISQEISEEEERSSVEFERFFDQIVKLILKDKDSKLLIVVDNLDRINRQDALKIWSTLQTYLQRRLIGRKTASANC